ncbi:MAG: DUF4115 domain-containing protein [Coriobacteriia bacterium]|nr:DUF4115 domain-containing protein [Coriobacteriia bacterium]
MPVGQRLANERRSRGKSMADISAATRIMASKLEALEHDRFDELPAPVYVRGYISAYARALGLDPGPFLAEYERDVGTTASGVRLSAMPEMESVVPLGHQTHALPTRVWVVAVVLVVLASLTAWVVRALSSSPDEVTPVPPASSTPATAPAASGPGAPTTPAGSVSETVAGVQPSETEESPGFVVRVDVSSGMASWLRVTVDGRLAYEGTLTGGSTKQWTVQREAVVRAGKPSAVTVTRDGAPVSFTSAGGVGVATITASP